MEIRAENENDEILRYKILAISQQVRPSGDCMDLKSTANTHQLKSCRAIYKMKKNILFQPEEIPQVLPNDPQTQN